MAAQFSTEGLIVRHDPKHQEFVVKVGNGKMI